MKRFLLLAGEAVKAIFAAKLRTTLSVLAIALGIAGVTLVVAAVNGAYAKAYEIIETFGPDSLFIIGGTRKMRAAGNRERTLTVDDVLALKEQFPSAYIVVPMRGKGNVRVGHEGEYHQTFVVGSSQNYGVAWSWPIVEGTDFSAEDVETSANVCIIGSYIKDEVFGGEDAVGRYMNLGAFTCEVIGVLQERSTSGMGRNMNDRVIMPITTVMKKLHNDFKTVSAIRMRFENMEYLDYHTERVESFMRHRHQILPGQDDDFTVISPTAVIKFFVAISGALVIFLGVITLMSVIVGGFVMANLFLISVSERVKEIGIRRAIGATKTDIFVQFIFEFLGITFMGAVAGFAIGAVAGVLLSRLDIFTVAISPGVFMAAVGASVIIALAFGIAPARRAAAIEPITAIRS